MGDDTSRPMGRLVGRSGRCETSRALVAAACWGLGAVDRGEGTDAAAIPLRAIGGGIAMVGESVHDGVLLLKLGALQDGRSPRIAM
jgi:hypothetical protein